MSSFHPPPPASAMTASSGSGEGSSRNRAAGPSTAASSAGQASGSTASGPGSGSTHSTAPSAQDMRPRQQGVGLSAQGKRPPAPPSSAPHATSSSAMAGRTTRPVAAGTRRTTPAASAVRARAVGQAGGASASATQTQAQRVPSRLAQRDDKYSTAAPPVQRQASVSRPASTQQSAASGAEPMPSSLFAALPRPSLGEVASTGKAKEPQDVHQRKALCARLLQLAQHYSNMGLEVAHGMDADTVSFYALLALCTDPTSRRARRLFAQARLLGGNPFPFGPSRPFAPSTSHNGSYQCRQAEAHLAIEILRDGNEDPAFDKQTTWLLVSALEGAERDREAYELLSQKRPAQGEALPSEGSALPFALPESLGADLDRQGAIEETRRAGLAVKTLDLAAATDALKSARTRDPYSWLVWTALADRGADHIVELPKARHTMQRPYIDFLREGLSAQGIAEAMISQTIADVVAAGASYFDAQVAPREVKPAFTIAQEAEGMQRTLSDSSTNTLQSTDQARVAKRPVASSAQDNAPYARPGSRGASTTVKRARVAPEAEANSAKPPLREHYSTRAIKGAADSIRRAVGPSSKVKASVEAVRQANLLATSKINEPPRPPSSASSSGKSSAASAEVTNSPIRRSARSAVAQPADASMRLTSSQARKASRPLQPAATPSPAEAEAPQTGYPFTMSTSMLQTVVDEATRRAREVAAFWTAIDDAALELIQTFGAAYAAIRGGRGKVGLALLRARGPLSVKEADGIKRETALLGTEPSTALYGGLDDAYRDCADVRCLMGRAYHSLGHYHKAEEQFDFARYKSPSLVQHMDIYSLTLFHLQRDVQLSALADDLASIESDSCEAHIAMGNVFALQRMHVHARQAFQRACLVAPQYAYAYTLAAYESLELGHLKQSLRYFREALLIDPLHWNALAGLGQIYLHNDKRQAAAHYYKRALDLVPGNAVLWDIYGRVMLSTNRLTDAEKAFTRSLSLDDSSATSHVKLAETLLRVAKVQTQSAERAQVQVGMSRTADTLRGEAHKHLLAATKLAPEEAHIHLLLAKSYMNMGEGTFATLRHSHRSHVPEDAEANAAEGKKVGEVSVADLAYMSAVGPAHLVAQQHQIRATGYASLPDKYKAEVSKHLCAAIDLNPRLTRYVKAMGEGARAALAVPRGRLMGGSDDAHFEDGTMGASMLMDPSGMSGTDMGNESSGMQEGETSMLESGEMDEILEDEDEHDGEDSEEYSEGGSGYEEGDDGAVLEDSQPQDNSQSHSGEYEDSSIMPADGEGNDDDHSMSI